MGFLLHEKVFANLRNQHIVREFGLIVLEAEGVRQIFLNLHLPDDGTLRDRGLSLEGVLEDICVVLQNWWVAAPWQHLVCLGDFNTVHPGDLACTTVALPDSSIVRHTARAALILAFCTKWQISWHASVSEEVRFSHQPLHAASSHHHTHVHKVSKNGRVIDYMCCASISGHPGSLKYDVHPELAIFSDHWPLIGTYSFAGPGSEVARPKSRSGRPRLRPIKGIKCTNRFAELMETRVDEVSGLADFTECVYSAHRDAVLECGESLPPSLCSMSALNEITRVELDQAPDNVSRVLILRQASISKKAVLKNRLTEKFVRSALTAPREDRSTSRARVHPLRIGDEDTFDTTRWETEFRAAYTKLFGDEANGPVDQLERLKFLGARPRGAEDCGARFHASRSVVQGCQKSEISS